MKFEWVAAVHTDVLIPLFRSFILIGNFTGPNSDVPEFVLIPLFRSFILIRDELVDFFARVATCLNPFVQVFYSNILSMLHIRQSPSGVLIPLFRSFILMLTGLLPELVAITSVLIPLFRSFILIRTGCSLSSAVGLES